MPNREPTGQRASSGPYLYFANALDAVRAELGIEIREADWIWEVDGEQVAFHEFRRVADAPGATGKFRGSAPNGVAYIEASL
jgi:hypothetical protein